MANIKVFARLKPCQDTNQGLISREDSAIYISPEVPATNDVHHVLSSGCANLPESKSLRFRFTHVFGMDSSQKNVFDVAAKDIVKAFLQGYNGTIFAYGQTGAGKTFTIQGENCLNGSDSSGLIPQSLSLIFQDIGHNQHETVNIHVSFLEIYKETAYDLLGPLLIRGSRKAKDLSKVLVTMGGNGSCHLHGLSYHHVTSEEEATRLYQLGVANRKTAVTPDNQRSSRSHTVFSIMISRQKHGTEIFLRSKLNLVDLAGSERVWKSSIDGQQLSEAKFINLSLHHLESVIIALQKFNLKCSRNHSRKKQKQTGKHLNRSSSATLHGARNVDAIPKLRLKSASSIELGKGRQCDVATDHEPVHVPYRNSLLTMVLQDSLGGNCHTAMIAALSVDEKNLSETISSCRFAQRVARIMNKPIRNEEVDRNMVIKRLQTTLAKLHLELANYKHESVTLRLEDESSPEDEQTCVELMHSFLSGRINDPVSHGINTPRRFRTSLRYLRKMLVQTNPQMDRGGDEGLQSTDDRDSGVRTGSEPTSPLTSEGENDVRLVSNFIAQLPSPVPTITDEPQHRLSINTQESGISLNTEHGSTQDTDESSPGYSHEMPQPPEPGTSEVSTQTGLLKTCEGRQTDKKDVCGGDARVQPTAREDVLLWELELQKEALLNKTKMFTSRLADQRARLVVMLRRGDIPEELENEKIVELQLQKKQREVESKLSFVIKKLADLKYTDPLKQCQVKEQHPTGTQAFRELQLKEKSTRQKLLARREEMKNFGFPSATISGQSTPSSSRIRFGTGHSSLSDASSVTSPWEDGGRESAVSSIPASNRKNLIAKHAASKGGLSDSSHHVHKVTPSSQNYFAKRGFPRQQRFPSKDKCGMSRNDRPKSCLLVKFMNDSHQALYHKSTFPRRIESGAYCDMRGTKSARAQRTMSGIQRARAKNVPNLARSSSSGCLKLEEQSSDSSKAERVPILHPVTANSAENSVTANNFSENQAELSSREDTCTTFENSHLLSSGETATSESREDVIQEQVLPSVICLNREQRVRVMRIREFINAAEVIQRTWRLYKRNKHGESEK